MSSVNLKASWSFDLDPADTRLVLRALGGRLGSAEVVDAKELGDRLTRQRAAAAKALYDQMAQHEEHITGES